MNRILSALPLLIFLCTACQKEMNEDLTAPLLKTDSTSLSFSDKAGKIDSFNIQANIEWHITISPQATDWLTVNIDNGNGNAKIIVTTTKSNASDTVQKATLIIVPINNVSVQPVIITVTQAKPTLKPRNAYGGSKADEFFYSVATDDGGFIAIGRTASNDGDISGLHSSWEDIWIVKMDANGNKVWQKIMGGTDRDLGGYITKTPDGNYVMVCHADSRDGDLAGLQGSSNWIIKINGAGDVLLSKLVDGANGNANVITPAAGGGYILAGSNNHFWVAKIDENAKMVWEKTLGGQFYDNATSAVVASDGGYIIAGSSQSPNGDIVGNHGSYDIVVFKLDENGNKVWLKCYGGSGDENGARMIKTSDGGYLVNASTNCNDGDVSGNHGKFDMWVFKIDAAGNKVWQKTLGGSDDDAGTYIISTSDGNYIAVGSTNSNDGDVSNLRVGPDGWAVKLDANGNKLWQKVLGGSDTDSIVSVVETSPGNYVAVGLTWSNDLDVVGYKNDSDGWLMPFRQ